MNSFLRYHFLIVVVIGSAVLEKVIAVPAPFHAASSYDTIPSRVDSKGKHLSYDLKTSFHIHLVHRRDASQHPGFILLKSEQLYFKISAFGKTIFLNLSASLDWGSEGTLVEYVKGDGSVEIQSPQQRACHYTGQVHSSEGMEEKEETIGEMMEGAWTAISACSGLHGVISLEQGHLFIEPSSGSKNHFTSEEGGRKHRHTITKGQASLPSTQCHTRDQENSDEDKQNIKEEGYSVHLREKRLVVVRENFVETVVVADASMLQYHQRGKLESYIFTLMNIVSHLYRDVSLGHSIKIVLLRVLILESNQTDFTSGTNTAHEFLQNFCSFASNYNASHGGLGHDVAVLITRQGICETRGTSCNILGMGDIGSVCKPGKGCNINRDSGLSTAFTIAHEIGHNLNIRHDGDPNTRCKSNGKFIMAPSFAESANPHLWSECSRQQLTKFFSSPESQCLSNRPPRNARWFSTGLLLPGNEYTPSEQCQLQMGPTASHCAGKPNECATMWCRSDESAPCANLLIPPAPGTECNISSTEMGVCYQGRCVTYKEVETPVDGGWGLWGEWTNCSFSCGTGIKYRDRECNSPSPKNGGHYCLGERRQYRTCNQHACSQERDIRQQYCELYPPNARHSVWKAVPLDRIIHLGLDVCISHCIPMDAEQSVVTTTTLNYLPNGTPCLTDSAQSQGVCLSGKCKPTSCDGELGTESRRDECGVWCGNGTTCTRVAGSFNQVENPGRYRYYLAMTLPAGSTHIHIQEVMPSRSNFLALHGTESGDLFNEKFIVQHSKTFTFGGNLWTYERDLQNGAESLQTTGPIDESVGVYILANQSYNGINFTFNLRKDSVQNLSGPVYFWNFTDWGSCNVDCGRGQQERGVACWKISPGGIVEEEEDRTKCDSSRRPMSERECSMELCQYRWVVSEWNQCNVTCGEGTHRRQLKCEHVRKGFGMGNIFVRDNLCPRDIQPDVEGICHAPEPCSNFYWSISPWSECNGTCNNQGYQFRTTTCEHRNGTQLPSQFCSTHSIPVTQKTCTKACTTSQPLTTTPPSPPTTTPPPPPSCVPTETRTLCNLVVRSYGVCTLQYFITACCQECD